MRPVRGIAGEDRVTKVPASRQHKSSSKIGRFLVPQYHSTSVVPEEGSWGKSFEEIFLQSVRSIFGICKCVLMLAPVKDVSSMTTTSNSWH